MGFSRSFTRKLALTAALISVGFSDCSRDVAEMCAGEFDAFSKKVDDARLAMAPWVPSKAQSGRSLASVDSETAPKEAYLELDASDRRVWEKWAAARMAETQTYVDLMAGKNRFAASRKELSELINEIISFSGYATLGRAKGMDAMLRRIEERTRVARRLACD